MSKENREQIESLLDDHFDKDLVAQIVASRPAKKWTADDVKKVIDDGPYTAKKAAASGLIDKLAYQREFEALMHQDLKGEKFSVSRDYGQDKKDDLDLSNPFALFKLFSSPRRRKPRTRKSR